MHKPHNLTHLVQNGQQYIEYWTITISSRVRKPKMKDPQDIQIRNTRYFNLINQMYKYSLYVPSMSKKITNQSVYLVEGNKESLGQIWQIACVSPNGVVKQDCYQIVHTRSTYVLTKMDKSNEVKLASGGSLDTQLFVIEKVSKKQPNVYRFARASNKSQYLHFDKMLKIAQIKSDDPKCHWLISPSIQSTIIRRSCYFENAFSNLVIDVPQASLQQGCAMVQHQFNNRFNQRFTIWMQGSYFQIASCHSKLLLTVNNKCREGDEIIQKAMDKSKEQNWILEYQGRNLYLIRLAVNSEMMMGIRQKCYKELTPIICTKNQEFACWKIVGYIPKKKQVDN